MYTVRRKEMERRNNKISPSKLTYSTPALIESAAMLSLVVNGPSAGFVAPFNPDALRGLSGLLRNQGSTLVTASFNIQSFGHTTSKKDRALP